MNKTVKIISIVLLVLGIISLLAGIAWQVSGRITTRNLPTPRERGDFPPPEGSEIPAPLNRSARPGRFGFRTWMPFNLPILLIGAGACLLLAGIVLLLVGSNTKKEVKTSPTIKKPKVPKEVKTK